MAHLCLSQRAFDFTQSSWRWIDKHEINKDLSPAHGYGVRIRVNPYTLFLVKHRRRKIGQWYLEAAAHLLGFCCHLPLFPCRSPYLNWPEANGSSRQVATA